MDEKGLPFPRVVSKLREARGRDFTYHAGEILGSMCTAPDPAAAEAVALFLETNLGDPGHFPGTRRLEQEVQEDLLMLAGLDPTARPAPQALLTSGGTESNLLAVAAAREAWQKEHGRHKTPTVVVPETAHFSFEKARRLTGTRLLRVPTQGDRAQPEKIAQAIDEDTCLLVAIAGTTETGTLDPVDELAQVARDHQVPLHVDAALGGFLLPFLKGTGRKDVPWDFRLPGVTTVTLDPHKMGTVPVPAGALLARDRAHLDAIAVETPYVTSEKQAGLLGTRPGAAAAACWAAFRHKGREGYTQMAGRCMDNAEHLRKNLKRHKIPYHGEDLNVVLVKTDDPDAVQRELSDRGWRVNVVHRLSGIRIVVMPHVERLHLDALLVELVELVQEHPYQGTPDDGNSHQGARPSPSASP